MRFLQFADVPAHERDRVSLLEVAQTAQTIAAIGKAR